MSEIINGADQAAVVGMLAKFAADRATSDSVADAKEGKTLNLIIKQTLRIYLQNAIVI